MFTGLVETIGTVTSLTSLDPSVSGGNGTSLTISGCGTILGDAQLGDSISVNGTCLTVTEFTATSFKVGVAPETLRRTNLGRLVEGGRVNLERAVSASTRMGGHFVQGHVDTTAEILSVTPDGNALTFRFQPKKKDFLRYIVHKGYIGIDGTSLTVTQVNDAEGWWEIMLITYSQERVVLANKVKGDTVNIEVDMMAKYAEKSLGGILGDGNASSIPLLEKIVERVIAKSQGAKP